MLLSLCIAVATATQPKVEVTPEGIVRGKLVVSATPDEVMDRMRTSAVRVKTIDNGAEVTAKADGDCEVEHVYVPHPFKAVTYDVRTCVQGFKVHSKLIASPDFETFEGTWSFQPIEGGTQVVYDLKMVPSFYVPSFVMKTQTKKGVMDALEGMQRSFGG